MQPAMHLYITHALYYEIYTMLLEVIQLMSIAGYEAYVCMCFFMYKTLCAAFIWLPWDAHSRPYVCLYCTKKCINFITKKYWNKNEKHFLNGTKSRDAAAKKNRVGISSMRKSIYRRSGNFRCYNIFVNVRAYENLTHEYFLTTNYSIIFLR